MREIISVKNLYKLYRVGDSVVRALDGVSFSVYEGEFCAIVGTSGSGKSTLLNIIGGIDGADEGSITIDGEQQEIYGDIKNFTGSFERNLDMVQDASKG